MTKNISIKKLQDRLSKNSDDIASVALAVIAEHIPIIGIGKEIFDKVAHKIYEERLATLIDELAQGNIVLSSEIIANEDFIHSVLVIYKASVQTRHREKIKKFAHLLISAIEKEQLATDKFDEFADILESMSSRELKILSILYALEKNYQQNNPKPIDREKLRYDVITAQTIWTDFEQIVETELDISPQILPGILSRLTRTGLYEPITGSIWGYKGGLGKITSLYIEFADWIQEQFKQ